MESHQFKILILGDSHTGKSTIVKRFTSNVSTNFYAATLGVEVSHRVLEIGDHKLKLQIWDIGGTTRYKHGEENYYNGASACIIVYDSSNESSFKKVLGYINEHRKHISPDKEVLAIVANNRSENIAVDDQIGRAFAHEQNALFFSIKPAQEENDHNAGIESVFETIGQKLLELHV